MMYLINRDKFSVFQENSRQYRNVFDIPYYQMLRKYLLFLGLDPYRHRVINNIILYFILCNVPCVFVPQIIEIYVSISNRDSDLTYDSLPHLFVSLIGVVKVLNVHFHIRNFKKLFSLVMEDWKILRDDELRCLEKITKRASTIAHLYRTCMLSSMIIFLFLPLFPYILDVFLPLNGTRPRQQLLHVNYLLFDAQQHFFPVYLQLSWAVIVAIMGIIAIDSLYITLIHHASGMFAVCGYQIQKAAEMGNADGTTFTSNEFERFKRCFITHQRAIQFYEILKNVSTKSFLFQVGLSMVGISVTAVQLVSSLDTPREAVRTAVLLIAKQFHLFVVSLPGQVLMDHCSDLAINIYCCKWYTTSVKIQKMILVTQIRCNRLCWLTAGGLYTLSIENFGTTLKTCISYVTMLLSLKE